MIDQLGEDPNGISRASIEQLLDQITTVRAGVIGDVCLDMYWQIDMMRSELSRETPHHTLPVVEERYSPGAAGNVAANLRAIGCSEVYVCSVIGEDWRGELLKRTLQERGIHLSYLIASPSWTTPSYCKPIRNGLQQVRQEDARLDFQNYVPLSKALTDSLIERLDQMAEQVDVIAVTDQLTYGVIGDAVRERLSDWSKQGKIVLVDSRERISLYRDVIVKPNEVEANNSYPQYIEPSSATSADWADLAVRISRHTHAPCVITLGGNGSIWAEQGEYCYVPSLPVAPPIDIVGAGDCFASAMISALGAGSSGEEAMRLAHYASAVSIKKLETTGTASPEEILLAYDYYAGGM